MRLIDSHAHLNADRFDADVDAVVAAARTAGLERILVPGWNVRSSERALELVDLLTSRGITVSAGPTDATTLGIFIYQGTIAASLNESQTRYELLCAITIKRMQRFAE